MPIEGLSEKFASNEVFKDMNHVDDLAGAHLGLIDEGAKPWHGRLTNDKLKTDDNLKVAEGFKTVDDLFESFLDVNSRIRKVPKKPDDYKIPDGEGFKADEKLSKLFREVAHKRGLDQDDVNELTAMWNGFVAEAIKGAQDEEKGLISNTVKSLKDLLKGDYDSGMEKMNKATGLIAKATGLEDDDLKAVMAAASKSVPLSRMLMTVADSVSEDSFRSSQSSGSPTEEVDGETFMKEVFKKAKE